MLTERGFEIIETRFCMYYFFRFLFGNWLRLPWKPRILIRGLCALDKLLPIGPPMDLMMLAQLTSKREARVVELPAAGGSHFLRICDSALPVPGPRV